MIATDRLIRAIGDVIHRRLLWLIVGTYALAAIAPGPGAWIRGCELGRVPMPGGPLAVSLPMAMLAALLFNAGLGVRLGQLTGLARDPRPLAAGLLANLGVPCLFILAASRLLGDWHSDAEVQAVVIGLALVAAMPIAGSSAAWSRHARGHAALSLGLVIGSTLMSPLTTPIALEALSHLVGGDAAARLRSVASHGTGGFLGFCVLAPSLAGIAARALIGGDRIEAASPSLKLGNSAILLVLCYANAAVSLPGVVAAPDPDFLAMAVLVVAMLGLTTFGAGWTIGRALDLDRPSRTSLMFGLGMNNNGTGLVLASMAMADHPKVLIPLLAYNLVQHLLAGGVDRVVGDGPGGGSLAGWMKRNSSPVHRPISQGA